jgi:hypothetical protein
MAAEIAPAETADEAVRAYKAILAAVIERRPSGTRQRLADALGKNRSFVTQITSPAYAVPLPARHIPAILSACRFGAADRDAFLAAYERAHPGKAPRPDGLRRNRHLSLTVPDLGDDARNASLDKAISDFVQKIAHLIGPQK